MEKILRVLFAGYKHFISPLLHSLGGGCRFHPTCADYSQQAILEHGLARGSWMALKRIARCNPCCSGGVDPVPSRHQQTS